MTGAEYEQFVRAILCQTLGISPEKIRSTHSPGVTLPNAGDLEHQIDLFFVDETEVAEYVTIIECKYRSSRPIEQSLLQNLAFVRDSMRAHKAIMVSNQGFTSGAKAVAESQRIALLTIKPDTECQLKPASPDVDALFRAAQTAIDRSPGSYEVAVVCKLHSDGSGGRDLVSELLADPEIRRKAHAIVQDPEVRETVRRVASENPDLARKVLDLFNRRRS